MSVSRFVAFAFVVLAAASAWAGDEVRVRLSLAEALEVGRKVWLNECGGRVEGLTAWKDGERSFGIGHCLWYPAGERGPFDESFPRLVEHLRARGAAVPAWLRPGTPCPWNTHEEFLAAEHGPQMTELRELLRTTVPLQAEFMVSRLEQALPRMLLAAEPGRRALVQRRFQRVLESGARGAFALVDYVNFKGEGTLATERYRGEGWGLLQVLDGMTGQGPALPDFVRSATETLARRVGNAAPELREARWLLGWQRRVARYLD